MARAEEEKKGKCFFSAIWGFFFSFSFLTRSGERRTNRLVLLMKPGHSVTRTASAAAEPEPELRSVFKPSGSPFRGSPQPARRGRGGDAHIPPTFHARSGVGKKKPAAEPRPDRSRTGPDRTGPRLQDEARRRFPRRASRSRVISQPAAAPSDGRHLLRPAAPVQRAPQKLRVQGIDAAA